MVKFDTLLINSKIIKGIIPSLAVAHCEHSCCKKTLVGFQIAWKPVNFVISYPVHFELFIEYQGWYDQIIWKYLTYKHQLTNCHQSAQASHQWPYVVYVECLFKYADWSIEIILLISRYSATWVLTKLSIIFAILLITDVSLKFFSSLI